jgi:hypothetical protein
MPTECIYGFRTNLKVNNDYFLKQHEPIDLSKGEARSIVFFAVGTELLNIIIISASNG